jgi:predicted transposase YdaD
VVVQEARLEARQEGRQEGRRAAQVALVLRLLERRLGPADKRVRDAVAALPDGRLEALADAVFDLDDRAALLRWLQQA